MSEPTEKLTPQSVDERLICMMVNRPSGAREIVRRHIEPEQIQGTTARKVFEACLRIFKRQTPPPMQFNHDMVIGELQVMGVFDKLDKDVLRRCLRSEFKANELSSVLGIIQERTKTTLFDAAITELQQTDDPEKRIEIAHSIAALSKDNHIANSEKILTLDDWINEVDTIDTMPDCVPTGFPLLDRMLGGGWSRGGYHIISAPPGTGKTIMMLTAWKYQLDLGIPSIYINYEIARSLFMKFMFAQFTGVNVQQPNRYTVSEIESAKESFKEQVRDLYDRNLLLITDPMAGSSKYWQDIETMLTEFSEDYGAQCVFFDTVNSVSAKTRKGQDARWNEYELIARDTENLCQSLNLAVIFSAQQDSESVKRDDKTPKLGDVAGSKALTEKAASITHLMRTDLYNKKDGVDYSELHITKNRMMGTELGTAPIRIKYDPKHKRLYEMGEDDQSAPRTKVEVTNDTFVTTKEITGVKNHPTLQLDLEDENDGKDL